MAFGFTLANGRGSGKFNRIYAEILDDKRFTCDDLFDTYTVISNPEPVEYMKTYVTAFAVDKNGDVFEVLWEAVTEEDDDGYESIDYEETVKQRPEHVEKFDGKFVDGVLYGC